MKTLFTVIVIGSKGKNYWKTQTVEADKITVKINGKNYSGSISESWFKKYGFLGRFFHGLEGEHLLVFHEEAGRKHKAIFSGTAPSTTARILHKVKLYRGVSSAIKDQFTERSAMDIPWWALVIVVIVFIIGFFIVGIKQGWLLQILKGGVNP